MTLQRIETRGFAGYHFGGRQHWKAGHVAFLQQRSQRASLAAVCTG